MMKARIEKMAKTMLIICALLLAGAIAIIMWLEKENSSVNSRCEHYQTYSRKLCSRLDETQKENNELYTQNTLLKNENEKRKKESKQLEFYIKMLEIDSKKKQKGISVCPICGYKVKQDDKSDDSKSI